MVWNDNRMVRAGQKRTTRQLVRLDAVMERQRDRRRTDPRWHYDMTTIEDELCMRAFPGEGRPVDPVARMWVEAAQLPV